MASKTNRARRLERARAERRMARLAALQRRRRRIQAGIGGAVALIVVALGTTWALGGFDSKPAPVTLPDCNWVTRDAADADLTGLPASQVPKSGIRELVIETNLGEIRGTIDISSGFCAAASVDWLAKASFYNDTTCQRLDTNLRTLTCGGRVASYQFATEGLPRTPVGTASPAPDLSATPGADPSSYYTKGSIVLDNFDTNAVNSGLMFVYGDNSPLPPAHTMIGTVTAGMDILEQVAAGGTKDDSGTPATELTITSVAMIDPNDATATPTTASPSTDVSATTTPSAT